VFSTRFDELQQKNHSDKRANQNGPDEVFTESGWKDQDIAGVFHEGRKAGNAKGHQEETKDLPAVELGSAFAGSTGANDKSGADDGAEAKGSEPEARAKIKMVPDIHGIPDRVAPKNDASCVQPSEISSQSEHGRIGCLINQRGSTKFQRDGQKRSCKRQTINSNGPEAGFRSGE